MPKSGAVILELARSEQTYTYQRPIDYATAVLAGAIAAGWRGPVFIQGDHYQFNAKKYAADPEAMTEEIRRACRLAIDAGYRNIDIDTLHAGGPVEADDRRAAARELRPGGRADRAHPDARAGRRHRQRGWRDRRGRPQELDRRGAARLPRWLPARARRPELRAPSGSPRSASRPARRHGGVPLPGGGVAEVKLDFEVLRDLGVVAREYGLAGAVQHGASTLPDELFHRFPRGRDRRDPPGDRVPERALRAPGLSRTSCTARSRTGATPTPPTSASRTRRTSSSSTRPARRRSARSSASCGTSRPRMRSSPHSGARSPTCSPSWGSTGRAT